MSGSVLAERVAVVLQSQVVISSLSFFSTQWQKAFSASLYWLCERLLASLSSFQHLFVAHILWLYRSSLGGIYRCTQHNFPLSLCCVHAAAASGASHYNLFLFVSKAWVRNQFHPVEYSSFSMLFPPSFSLIHYHILFVVSCTVSKQKYASHILKFRGIFNCHSNLTARIKH